MKVHFLSGLGADERVFRQLDLPGIEPRYIQWIKPRRDEKLAAYAHRLLEQIDTDRPVILVGVSFGGIMAQEIAKLITCKKVIIISSIKSWREKPWQLHLVNFTKAHRLLPFRMVKSHRNWGNDYFFGTETKGESVFLKTIINETDEFFFKWAINQIVCWTPDHDHTDVFHIHGTEDRIFPYKPIQNCIPVEGAGHFMIVNRAKQVSHLIKQALQNSPSI